MAHDLTVWSTAPFLADDVLPDGPEWRAAEDGWVGDGRGWMLHVQKSSLEPEQDMPPEAIRVLPGIKYRTDLVLEPISAPRNAIRLLHRVSKLIAKSTRGFVMDPKEKTSLVTNVKRYVATKSKKREEGKRLIVLSWWFVREPEIDSKLVAELLSTIDLYLPEAMPRRYGTYEPPQYGVLEHGRDHFVEFVLQNLHRSIVWYSKRPVESVFAGFRPVGWFPLDGRSRFRCCNFEISVDRDCLAQPGWQLGLHRTWRAISVVLQPFFGDVRTLDQFNLASGDRHPVRAGWWNGVPRTLGHACVIGNPYLQLWPRYAEISCDQAGLGFKSTEDWSSCLDVTDEVGAPPEPISMRFTPYRGRDEHGRPFFAYSDKYPTNFPFGHRPTDANPPRSSVAGGFIQYR